MLLGLLFRQNGDKNGTDYYLAIKTRKKSIFINILYKRACWVDLSEQVYVVCVCVCVKWRRGQTFVFQIGPGWGMWAVKGRRTKKVGFTGIIDSTEWQLFHSFILCNSCFIHSLFNQVVQLKSRCLFKGRPRQQTHSHRIDLNVVWQQTLNLWGQR